MRVLLFALWHQCLLAQPMLVSQLRLYCTCIGLLSEQCSAQRLGFIVDPIAFPTYRGGGVIYIRSSTVAISLEDPALEVCPHS